MNTVTTVWVVVFLKQVGDEQIERIFSSEEKAAAFVTGQSVPGHWNYYPMKVE